MLISNAECLELKPDHSLSLSYQDVRIEQNIIVAVGALEPRYGESVLDATGAALLPGLHDHHVHFASYAAALRSVACGPPTVHSEKDLIEQLNLAAGGHGWLRGINYHESVAGDIDRYWLDRYGPKRPIRIQHRSGRLWILNSNALEVIRNSPPDKLSREHHARLDTEDGRLYDVDNFLWELTGDSPLSVAAASQNLASFGVTGINDMTPSNNESTCNWFVEMQAKAALRQKVRLSGSRELSEVTGSVGGKLKIGECKLHLHESDLPDFYDLCRVIRDSHDENRAVAVHCVTEAALVFALAALQDSGIRSGDRIEHASVVSPATLELLCETGLGVVTQPNFVLERGDTYLNEIPEHEHAWLYRCRTLLQNSVPLAFGTDLPFGHPDPWIAMQAATRRQTSSGRSLGEDETLTPESALAGFLGELDNPAEPRSITVGEPADLCLLKSPWHIARLELSSSDVRATILDGEKIYDSQLFSC